MEQVLANKKEETVLVIVDGKIVEILKSELNKDTKQAKLYKG